MEDSENKKKYIMERYNTKSYVEIYDKRYRDLQKEKFQIIRECLDLEKEQWVLDFGAGTGLLWEFLEEEFSRERKKGVHYFSLDLSREMLRCFRRKILERELKDTPTSLIRNINPHLICGDGEALPFRPSVFNLILSFTTLQNLPHMEQGLSEIIRTAKEGSRCIFTILKKKYKKDELMKKIRPFLREDSVTIREHREDLIIVGKTRDLLS